MLFIIYFLHLCFAWFGFSYLVDYRLPLPNGGGYVLSSSVCLFGCLFYVSNILKK